MQESLRQKLEAIEKDSSLCIEISNTELAKIIGGAYSIGTTSSKKAVCTCICNQSMCNFGACDNPPPPKRVYA